MANAQNLKVPTSSEAREYGRKGGIASGKARKEKATMKKTLEMLLDEEYIHKGQKTGKTYREMATLGLISGASKGNSNNYRLILEILGEIGQVDESQINNNITNIATLINNPVENRSEDNINE